MEGARKLKETGANLTSKKGTRRRGKDLGKEPDGGPLKRPKFKTSLGDRWRALGHPRGRIFGGNFEALERQDDLDEVFKGECVAPKSSERV